MTDELRKAARELAAPVSMIDVKTWQQRCDEDPAHAGIVSYEMVMQKMMAEIEELRAALAALTTKERDIGDDEQRAMRAFIETIRMQEQFQTWANQFGLNPDDPGAGIAYIAYAAGYEAGRSGK